MAFTYVLSDVHGFSETLKAAMKMVDLSGKNSVIFLGDCIDLGPDSCGVLKYIKKLPYYYETETQIFVHAEVGGNAWMEEKNNDIKTIVDYAVEHNIPVAAICGATFFMGENGYLDNRKHSSNTLELLKSQAPHYKGESNYIEKQAVSDSNVITANGTATLEFTKEIMLYLNAKPADKINEWYKFHKLGMYQK